MRFGVFFFFAVLIQAQIVLPDIAYLDVGSRIYLNSSYPIEFSGTISAQPQPVLINQIAHTLWSQGLFSRTISLQFPEYGLNNLQVSIQPQLPPIAVNSCSEQDNLPIRFGELEMTIRPLA